MNSDHVQSWGKIVPPHYPPIYFVFSISDIQVNFHTRQKKFTSFEKELEVTKNKGYITASELTLIQLFTSESCAAVHVCLEV